MIERWKHEVQRLMEEAEALMPAVLDCDPHAIDRSVEIINRLRVLYYGPGKNEAEEA